MPQYTILIYGPAEGGPTPEQMAEMHPRWMQYTQDLHDAGVHVAGEALQPVDITTTVRVRDGETQITDGPFAEAKEYLGGFYIIDVPDLDTALEWAAKIPSVSYGTVEVRPVLVFDDIPTAASAAQAASA